MIKTQDEYDIIQLFFCLSTRLKKHTWSAGQTPQPQDCVLDKSKNMSLFQSLGDILSLIEQ